MKIRGITLILSALLGIAVMGLLAAVHESPSLGAAMHDQLGNYYLKLGLPDLAVTEFRGAVQSSPTYLPGYQKLADTLTRLGRFSEAVEVQRKLVRIQPGSFAALLALGEAQMQDGQLMEAVRSLQRGITMIVAEKERRSIPLSFANDYWRLNHAYLSLGRAFAALGDFKRANDALWQAVETSSADRATRTEAYQMILKLTQAELAKQPDDPGLHFNLGRYYNWHGQYREAIVELERAAQLDSKLKGLSAELGRSYREVGDRRKQVIWLEKWVAAEPDNPRARSELGYAYLAVKDWEMARRECDALKTLDPVLAGELRRALANAEV